jgi:hypothetical protein
MEIVKSMAKFTDAIARRTQIPWRVEAAGELEEFPFNRNVFDVRAPAAKPTTQTPKATATGATTAGGILIRDGSNISMRRQPDFELSSQT